MKVLFISYYFDPFPGVGAKRMSYWVNNISKHGIEPTVITAIEQTSKDEKIIYLPRSEKTKFLSKIIKDEGVNWELDLISYFKLNIKSFNYDAVLISGGPFMHFGISKFLKRNFNTKVILDFRDPFSENPSFKGGSVKVTIKKMYEKIFLSYADSAITVNEYCEKLLVKSNTPITIIDNGYDESKLSKLGMDSKNKSFIISHAGTFISGVRSPIVFLETIFKHFKDNIKFYQFGKDSEYFEKYKNNNFFEYRGFFKYEKLIVELEKSDACVLISEGYPFESTTKIFDYIGLNKKILIITSGEIETGNLNILTKNYPNVVWSKNNEKDIKQAILKLQQMQVVPFDSYKFSRAYGLEKLVKLLNTL